ncbi:MAG: cysteine hydrolase family protein [Solirubrobacteraceae bacterium]
MGNDPCTAPDFAASALITIDTQRDLLDGQPLEVAGTSAVLPAIERLLDAFRRTRAPIVHIVRLYRRDGSNVDLCRRGLIKQGASILAPNSRGSELAPALLVDPSARLDPDLLLANEIQEIGADEVVIYKPRWGAFFGTPLEAHLRSRGVTTAVFCGCNFPNCPRTSIYEASERDFRVVLARDAVSGLYERGERELEAIGIALMTSDMISAAMVEQYAATQAAARQIR